MGFTTEDTAFMARAMQLAALGRRSAMPNPMVGCVIVRDGLIIGEGWHKRYGGPHAEVEAVAEVADKSLIEGATVYVSLEPCSHFGKTPPCADLLVSLKPAKVIVSNLDSNPLVAGKGLQKLREAGIETETGLLEAEGRELNRRFFTFIEKKRPYILLKWAQTTDGFVARPNFDSKWISGVISRKIVHKWRSEEAAILVGTRTAIHDNPRLNVRDWAGPDPVRAFIDKNLIVPNSHFLFDGTQPTLCYTLEKAGQENGLEYIRITNEGMLNEMLADMHARGLQSLIVEGGAALLKAFIAAGLWDEMRVFQADVLFGEGIEAPKIAGKIISRESIENDLLWITRNI